MNVSTYFLGKFKDGQSSDLEGYRAKSDSKKLVIVHEDATSYVYDDVDFGNVAHGIIDLYANALCDEGSYIIRKSAGDTNDKYFECEASESELNDTKYVSAYDIDDDVTYAISYLDINESDVFLTNQTIGKQEALNLLDDEIDDDEDVVRIDK